MSARATGIVSFPPPLKENAYQRLLYEALDREGFPMPDVGHFKAHWMLRNRDRVGLLHFHWPQDYYRHPPRPRGLLTGLKFALFVLRLVAARLLGYRVVWTVHEVYPMQTENRRLDRLGGWLLARFSSVLIANDEQTARLAREEFGQAAAHIAVVPHSSYVDAYPAGRPRATVREQIGVPADAVVFLLFGHVIAYKSIEWIVEAFTATDLPDARLVVAGLVMDEPVGDAVRRSAASDDRVIPLLRFIPDDEVAELFGAADVAVSPRQDGGTSGVLVLGLSMGMPVIAADVETYTSLTGGERTAWLFEPGDRASAVATFERAAGDRDGARAKASVAREQVAHLTWDAMGRATAELFRNVLPAEQSLHTMHPSSPEQRSPA